MATSYPGPMDTLSTGTKSPAMKTGRNNNAAPSKNELPLEPNFSFTTRERSDHLLHQLNNLRETGTFCDVVLICGDRSFPAHRCVLAASSAFLRTKLVTADERVLPARVVMANTKPDVLGALLNFTYTGRIELPFFRLPDLLQTTRLLGIEDLAGAANSTLLEHLSPKTVLEVRARCSRAGLVDNVQYCDRWIASNIHNVVVTKDFLSLCRLQLDVVHSHYSITDEPALPEQLKDNVAAWITRKIQEYSIKALLERTSKVVLKGDMRVVDCASELSVDAGTGFDDIVLSHRDNRSPLPMPSMMPTNGHPPHPTPSLTLVGLTKTSETSLNGLAFTEKEAFAVIMNFSNRRNSCAGGSSSSDSMVGDDGGSSTLLTSMTAGRCSAGVAVLADKVYVVGGYNRDSVVGSCEVYDPGSNHWELLPPLQTPRGRLALVALNGTLYAVGGSDGNEDTTTVEAFTPGASDVWMPSTSLLVQRSNLGSAVLNGLVYVVGGSQDSSPLAHVECFDPQQSTWSSCRPLNIPRSYVSVVSLNGHLYAIGGLSGWECVSSVEVYTPEHRIWRLGLSMQTPLRGAAVATIGDKIFVIGGHDGNRVTSSVEWINPEERTEGRVASLNVPRVTAAAAVVNECIYVVGGFSGSDFLSTVECFADGWSEWSCFMD